MKKLKSLLLLLMITLLFSCSNNDAEHQVVENDSTDINFVWQSTINDSTGKFEMRKLPVADTLTIPYIIDYLNIRNPNILLTFVKTSNDTAYLKIDDAKYLTQQMGSSGPRFYLSEVIYNLTELSGISVVNLDFKTGDHAAPGTFSKESFNY